MWTPESHYRRLGVVEPFYVLTMANKRPDPSMRPLNRKESEC